MNDTRPRPTLLAQCVAELIGTYLLVLFGCGVVHAAVLTGAQIGLWQVAIVWGIAIMLAIYVVGATSGAHINPAMTVALAVWGKAPRSVVVPYVAAQFVGAFLAAATLYALFGGFVAAREQERDITRGSPASIVTAMCYGEYYPSPGGIAGQGETAILEAWSVATRRVPLSTAFTAEALGTAILALVVLALTDDTNRGGPADRFAPVFIGLTVSLLISVLAPLTQACFNPARDWGPRVFAYLAGWGSAAIPGPNGMGSVVVYIAAPVIGALIGAGIYERIIKPGRS
ncbi:MAG: aquaporin family protein [Planctomycetaceae bacterium]|nr:aquaporin family protein [Planctomycetaceae bacterium]